MYFEDVEGFTDEQYMSALRQVYPTAILRGIRRKLSFEAVTAPTDVKGV